MPAPVPAPRRNVTTAATTTSATTTGRRPGRGLCCTGRIRGYAVTSRPYANGLGPPAPPRRGRRRVAARPARRPTGRPGGVNWLSVSSAPCGSRSGRDAVHGSSHEATTAAPSRSARGDAVVAVGHGERDVPDGRSPRAAIARPPITSAKPGGADACRSWMPGSTVAARWSPYPGTCSIVPAPWPRSAATQPKTAV